MRRMCMLLLTLVLVAMRTCGPESGATPDPADQAHRAWIQALQQNDRAAAQALLAPEFQMWVDRPLEQVRFKQDAKTGLGALHGVDVRPVAAEGAGRVGVSVWHFQKKDECYQTRLAQQGGGWRVTEWTVQPCGA